MAVSGASRGILPVVLLSIATLLISRGCSGPQPLSVAIRAEDERAYEAVLARAPDSPRQAYFKMKAAASGRSVEDVAEADRRLSTTRNPFDANRDRDAVSQGAVIFKHHCARCHGDDVRGGGPDMLPDYPCKDFHAFDKRFAVTLHRGAPRSWFRKIAEGYGDTVQYRDGPSRVMPAFGDQLAREQIWLVITYLQSLDVYALRQE